MILTTIAFMGVLSFQFVGWHLNAFMVNSHRSLMCGHLVLPCGKFSTLQSSNHTVTCQISRSFKMHLKVRIAHYWQNQTCAHSKCIKSYWNAGHTTLSSEQHLRTSFNCLQPFTVMNSIYLVSPHGVNIMYILIICIHYIDRLFKYAHACSSHQEAT